MRKETKLKNDLQALGPVVDLAALREGPEALEGAGHREIIGFNGRLPFFGIMLWNWPMMIANAVTFMLTVVIVIMKLYYG